VVVLLVVAVEQVKLIKAAAVEAAAAVTAVDLMVDQVVKV
jgi:hypothetical protein